MDIILYVMMNLSNENSSHCHYAALEKVTQKHIDDVLPVLVLLEWRSGQNNNQVTNCTRFLCLLDKLYTI